jgi:endo-1,4-beta-mannosidase
MRNSNISANHRLFIRNFITDFRRQSSINDYKLPNTLVCCKKNSNIFLSLSRESFHNEQLPKRFNLKSVV